MQPVCLFLCGEQCSRHFSPECSGWQCYCLPQSRSRGAYCNRWHCNTMMRMSKLFTNRQVSQSKRQAKEFLSVIASKYISKFIITDAQLGAQSGAYCDAECATHCHGQGNVQNAVPVYVAYSTPDKAHSACKQYSAELCRVHSAVHAHSMVQSCVHAVSTCCCVRSFLVAVFWFAQFFIHLRCWRAICSLVPWTPNLLICHQSSNLEHVWDFHVMAHDHHVARS